MIGTRVYWITSIDRVHCALTTLNKGVPIKKVLKAS